MKTFIIKQIAKNFSANIAVAKNVQVKHLTYMYKYNYVQLIKSYFKSLKSK